VPDFANAADFDSLSLSKAGEGIVAPTRREIGEGVVLYRFGKTEDLALLGPWWFEESQFKLMRQWAAEQSLAMPLAVRALCAVAHAYSEMRVLISARTKAPLLAWEGRSKSQRVGGKESELLDPGSSHTAPPITQLFIPGLWKEPVNTASLKRLSTEHFSEGASHIGGFARFPPGAIIQ
jgi:hypothetical protein